MRSVQKRLINPERLKHETKNNLIELQQQYHDSAQIAKMDVTNKLKELKSPFNSLIKKFPETENNQNKINDIKAKYQKLQQSIRFIRPGAIGFAIFSLAMIIIGLICVPYLPFTVSAILGSGFAVLGFLSTLFSIGFCRATLEEWLHNKYSQILDMADGALSYFIKKVKYERDLEIIKKIENNMVQTSGDDKINEIRIENISIDKPQKKTDISNISDHSNAFLVNKKEGKEEEPNETTPLLRRSIGGKP